MQFWFKNLKISSETKSYKRWNSFIYIHKTSKFSVAQKFDGEGSIFINKGLDGEKTHSWAYFQPYQVGLQVRVLSNKEP